MADQNLNVTITADASSLPSAITTSDQLSAAIGNIEKYLQTMVATSTESTAAITKLAEGHTLAAGAATKHAEAEGVLGVTLGKVESATGAAARAFEAIGFYTGEATERVEGLTEALEGIGKAALPLLAVGAGILALAAAFNIVKDAIEGTFEFIKGGVEEASRAQVAMASLGQAVRDQGGAWNEASQGGVEKFLDAIEHATTYSRGEALQALSALVAAGTSVAGSEKLVAVATDVAAASHRSLTEVVQLLREAELGRARGLEELDPKLKKLIASHADLNTVVNQLARDMAGQAAAALDTNAGKSEMLRNELGHIAEDIGAKLLPAINAGAEVLIHFAEEAQHAEPAFAALFDLIVDGASRAGHALADMAHLSVIPAQIAAQIGTGHLDDARKTAGSAGGYASDLSAQISGTAPKSHILEDAMQAANAMFKRDHAAALAEINKYKNYTLTGNDDPSMGTAGAGKEPFDFSPQADQAKTDQYAESQKQLDAWLKQTANSERVYEDAVKSASTAQEKQSADLALAAKVSSDARDEVERLSGAIATETFQQKELQSVLPAQKSAYENLRNEYNAYGAAIGKSPTSEEKAHLDELRKAMEIALGTYNETKKNVDEISSAIEKNGTALVDATSKTHAYAVALDEVAKANHKLAVDAAVEVANDLAERLKGQNERNLQVQYLADEEATYNQSIENQLRYYARRYQIAVEQDGINSAESKKYFDEILKLEDDEYKQRIDEHDAFMQKMKSTETSFLDDIIVKHESFRDALKNVWKQIEEDAENSLVSSLMGGASSKKDGSTEGGGIFGGLNSLLSGFLDGGTSNAASAGASPAVVTPLNQIAANTAALVAASVQSSIDTPGSNTVVDWGASTLAQIIPTASNGYAGYATGTPVPGYENSPNYRGAFTSASQSSPTTSAIAGRIGGAIGGAEGIAAGYEQGGVGGAIDSGLGALSLIQAVAPKFGPWGDAIAAAVGIGSLLIHHSSPGQDPDEYESQTHYGQDRADVTGTIIGSNGVNYSPDSATLSFIASQGVSNGGLGQTTIGSNGKPITSGGVDAAEMWLSQQNPNSPPAGYTQGEWAKQLAIWDATFGTSATGAGAVSQRPGDPNIGDLQITGAGSTINTSVSTLSAQLAALEQASSASGSNTPVFGLTRTYPSFASTLGPQQGTINSQTNAFTPASGGGASSTGGTVVYATVQVTAPTGDVPAETITKIAQAIKDIGSGIVPGSTTLSLAARHGGN